MDTLQGELATPLDDIPPGSVGRAELRGTTWAALNHDSRVLGGWQWTGIATARTGLPINVTVTRKATDMPDGNSLSSLRPNLVDGVPLYLDYRTTGLWLNSAAFLVPAVGTWGNLPRNYVRGPSLVQFDTGLDHVIAIERFVAIGQAI